MYPVIAALRALEAELNVEPPPPFDAVEHPINLNIGTIRGGDWPSTVAGECVTECRVACYPGDRVDQRPAGAAERVSGTRPGLVASTATTDARAFVLHGDTPAVCFGPYAENIHSIDERVHLPSVVQTAQALALLIRDWCG